MSNSQQNFEHIESIYWVFTQRCNDFCAHCYNDSGPQGKTLSLEDCLKIVDNLPPSAGRLILSGGEPLSEKHKLFAILQALKDKYQGQTQIMLQTNGDLLTGPILDQLLALGVSRFDVSSIDRYHQHQGQRLMELAELFESRGINGQDKDPLISKNDYLHRFPLSWGFWGATEDMWLGGNWARGRAYENKLWKQDHKHNFCSILSGAIGFLNGGAGIPQEISIQLWKINPCCPGTRYPLGDARLEKIAEVLAKIAQFPVFQALDKGDPLGMGEHLGISREFAEKRCESLGNVCLWCDEFFEKNNPFQV